MPDKLESENEPSRIQRVQASSASRAEDARRLPRPDPANDGTTELLRWGSVILLAGVVAIILLMTTLGGVGVEGAHSNAGWLALITGMMCLPFGLLLALLGLAKWLRKRRLSRSENANPQR